MCKDRQIALGQQDSRHVKKGWENSDLQLTIQLYLWQIPFIRYFACVETPELWILHTNIWPRAAKAGWIYDFRAVKCLSVMNYLSATKII